MSDRRTAPARLRVALVAGACAWLVVPAVAQQACHGEPSPGLAARLADALDGDGPARVHVAAGGGRVARLAGPLATQGVDSAAQALDLARRFAPLFGGAADFGTPRMRTVAGLASVHLPQSWRGLPVAGMGLTVRFDAAGVVLDVAGRLLDTAGLPLPRLATDDALALALAELRAQGRIPAGLPRVTARVRERAGAPRVEHDVLLFSEPGCWPMTLSIDDTTGACVACDPAVERMGVGNYKDGGNVIPFQTGKGKGRVHLTLAKALKGKSSEAKLRDVAHETAKALVAEDGFLFGRWSQVLDSLTPQPGSFLQSAQHDWSVASSTDPAQGAQQFDQTNAYHWLWRTANFYEGLFGGLATDFAVPAVVNQPGWGAGPVLPMTAGWTGADLGLGAGPGTFVFGDLGDGAITEDMSRDPTVVAHEYGHALLFHEGLTHLASSGPDGSPAGGSVAEAACDYFAASMHGQACLGPVLALMPAFAGVVSGPCYRNLSELKVLPDDFPAPGAWDVHEASRILSGAFWRLRGQLGKAFADDLLAAGLWAFPPAVPAGETEGDVSGYWFDGLEALLDTVQVLGGNKKLGAALGVTLERGVTGSATLGTGYVVDLQAGGTLRFDTAFAGSIASHRVRLALLAGSALSVELDSPEGSTLGFALEPSSGLSFTKPVVPALTGPHISQSGIHVLGDGIYDLDITLFAGAGVGGGLSGTYACELKVVPAVGACSFVERWSTALAGSYPAEGQGLGGPLHADAGTWWVNDTFSNFPDCGQPPQVAQVVGTGPDRRVRLESALSTGSCADNMWVIRYAKNLSVGPGDTLSFRAWGEVPAGDPADAWPNYVDKRARVALLASDGRELWYTLWHGEIDEPPVSFVKEVLLQPVDEGSEWYEATPWSDFAAMEGGAGAKVSIDAIVIDVDEGGWIEVDDLELCK
jgi:hypothetical protein